MKNQILVLSILFSLFSFCTVNAKDIQNVGPTYGRSDEEMGHESSLVSLKWPLKYLRYDLKDLLLTDGSAITELSKIDLNPIDRTLHLDGKLMMPDSLLLTMEEKAGDKLMNEHSFSFIIQFPKYVPGRYVEFQIKRFQLDGIDYSKGFHIISRIVPALLVNRSLINYFMDESKAPTDYSDKDMSKLVKQFIDQKIIEFKNDTIRINFNLKHFSSFKRYSDFGELKIWYFAPRKIKGTKEGVELVIEGGIGSPARNYITQVKMRQLKDKKELVALRSNVYVKYAYSKELKEKLENIVDKMISEIGFSNWSERELIEINDLKRYLATKAYSVLQKKDPYFSDEPKRAYEQYLKLSTVYATNTILDLKKRHVLDRENRNGGRKSTDMPFAIKRFSQKALNQFTNFFRDFELDEGEPLFAKLNVVMAPHLPGVIIKGDVNLDLNSIFSMGLDGEGIDFSGKAIRLDDKTYGKSIPFELSLYTYMRDNGVLELDIRSAIIGEGLNKVILNPKNDKGGFLLNFTKMATVHILKTFLISDPLAASEEAPTNPVNSRLALFEKIFKYKQRFQSLQNDPNMDIFGLLKIKEYDLNNPFNIIPAQIAEAEAVEFFNNVLGYDKESGRIQIYLDPTIFSEKIFYANNKIQLWNLEPLIDKKMDKTYMEFAIGNDTRSSTYLDHLYNRTEKRDAQSFTGTTGFKENEGPVDYSLKIDLKEFENTINSILTSSLMPHTDVIKSQLAEIDEGSFYTLEDLSLKALKDNTLSLKLSLNNIEKKKKGLITRAWNGLFHRGRSKFEIINNRASVTAKISLTTVPLSQYKAGITKKSPNEIFLGDTLIKIDLHEIGYKTINGGLFSKIANAMIGKVNLKNGIIGSTLKKLILKFAGPTLNERGNKNGSTVLGGIHLNNYAKMYTHKGEILLQVNPRFAGPVWDFYMLTNKTHKGVELGLRVDAKSNILGVDFVSAFTPSTVDKIELYNIMKVSQEISKEIRGKSQLAIHELLKIYDRLFYNNDRTKKSLYHKFMDVVNSYEEIALLGLEKDLAAVAKNENFNFTAAGAELMHIAITASTIKSTLLELKSAQTTAALNYEKQMNDIIKKLENQFITPLTEFYKIKFLENNKRILKKDITDWNYLVYPDALFSQKAFEYLRK